MALQPRIRKRRARTAQREYDARRGQAGFSLTEMLAVLIILALVGMVVVNGLPSARAAYVSATDAANAQVLLSTTTKRLRDVLSTAKRGTVSEDAADSSVLISFESYETGNTVRIKNTSSGLCVETQSKADPAAAPASTPLVTEAAAKGLDADLVTRAQDISHDPATGLFTVTDLQVRRGDATVGNASVPTLEVRPLDS